MQQDNAKQSLSEKWAHMPVAKRILLVSVIMFGFLGVLNASIFFDTVGTSAASTYQWAAALGLSVSLNSLYWFFSWQRGAFRRIGYIVLAILLVLSTFFALYVGLQALHADALGVGLFQA